MANVKVTPIVGVDVTVTADDGTVSTYTFNEQDKVTNLVYKNASGVQETIAEAIVDAIVISEANYSSPASPIIDGRPLSMEDNDLVCPVSALPKFRIVADSMILDVAEKSRSKHVKVKLANIISVGEVRDTVLSVGGSDSKYADIAEAIAAAKEGDTVALASDVTLSVTPSGTNNGAYTLPAGVDFDGKGHVVTIDDASWTGTEESPAGHVFSVTAGKSTIKNVTIIGSKKAKAGVVCWGKDAEATLIDVNIQNCGTVAVQVTGGKVTATNLTTSGSTWGAVNVDKSSDGTIPSFTLNSGDTSAEKVELYTEITDQDVIHAPAEYKKVVGIGETLKGFVYYTTDVTKLGVATAEKDGVTYVYETEEDIPAEG